MRVSFTEDGIKAIYNSMANGIKFEVSYFKIGRSILTLAGEDYSDVVDQVYPSPNQPIDIKKLSSMIKYYFNSTKGNQATFEITLDQTIGDSREVNAIGNVNFLIGNIGLFYHNPLDGNNFANDKLLVIASNEIPYKKYRQVSVNEAADIYRDYITLTFQDISNLLNVTTEMRADYSQIPSVATSNDLPDANSAPYGMYAINDNSFVSGIAVKRIDYLQGEAVWDIYSPNNGIVVPSTSFDDTVGIGNAVCYKDGKFTLCDGFDINYPYIGIRTNESTIINSGNYKPGMNLIVGQTYYATSNGGLSYNPSLYTVGLAVSYDTLNLYYSDFQQAINIQKLQKTPTVLLGDSSKFQVTSITPYIAGNNYIDGLAVINKIPINIKTVNGAITEISGWPTQIFNVDPSGTYVIEQAGNKSGSGNIITSYGSGNNETIGNLEYVPEDDPVVQKSYLRVVREQLYNYTEISISDLNTIPQGKYMALIPSNASNAPTNFQGGYYITEKITSSNGEILVSIQSMTRPNLKWLRSYTSGQWTAWLFAYASFYPGTSSEE